MGLIITSGLTKEYNHRTVLEDLNIRVAPGEIYGFLGPNGAGKSTTIGMILGIVPVTRGEVLIGGKKLGQDYFGIKGRIGVVGEFQHFYKEMTAFEYLSFFADLYGLANPKSRIESLLARVELLPSRNLHLVAFSKGMQQKLSLVRALLHDPELLILDEPVSSLDPHGIKQVRQIILEENRRGKTIFISSHLLSEIEKTCHHIGIISQGRLVAEDTMAGLTSKLERESVVEVEMEEEISEGLVTELRNLAMVAGVTLDAAKHLTIRTKGRIDQRGVISKFLNGHGLTVLNLKKNQMSLEEAFVTLTETNITLLTGGRANDE